MFIGRMHAASKALQNRFRVFPGEIYRLSLELFPFAVQVYGDQNLFNFDMAAVILFFYSAIHINFKLF